MTQIELNMIADLLTDYADSLSNNCCNDLDLRRWGMSPAEAESFDKAFHEWNGDPENHNPKSAHLQCDYAVVAFLASKLKEHAKHI